MDLATVGGFFISAFLQVLFDRIAPREIWDFFKARKLDGPLRNLKITLLAVKKLIQDAEDKQFDDSLVREWLREVQDAVYDAEDLLDAVHTEAMLLKLEEESSSQSKTSELSRKMEKKLKEIIQQLKDLVEQKNVLGLKEGVGQKPAQRLQTTSLMGETVMYGRDSEKDAILELLLSDSNNLDVIAIKGMGGLGKTALAQLVYNDGGVKEHFGFRAWVYVSEELDVLKVTRTILEAVSSSASPSTNNLDLIQVELQQKLSEKRFLLVLDDVWNENRCCWEMLKKPFLHGAKGSKILVTTRNEGVAAITRTVLTHNLRQLSEKDSWLLFAKQASINDDSPALQAIRRKIVKKCEGLPLAIKVLGGLLRYKPREEWVKVLESNMWELKDAKTDILPVLRVSYHYLPSHLKQCFAYSAIYPKGHVFEKEELIRLWMAQGFLLRPGGREKMEELGDEYFNELVSRSFFHHPTVGKTRCFVMHDLINDLVNFASGQLCFCMQRGSTLQEVPPTTRHLSYFMRKGLNQFANVPVANCLRTFLMLDASFLSRLHEEEVSNTLLQALSLLRVLSLRGYKICKLPESIGNLKHLRYLDLSETAFTRLPDSVCNLYNLQTLLLIKCSYLIELPKNMWKLVNLRYLAINECCKLEETPINIGGLKSLRVLDTFIVGNSNIKELRELSELQGFLRICQLQKVVCPTDVAEARLNDKKYLKELALKWSENEPDDSQKQKQCDVLDELQPHQNLRRLTITSYGGARFPNWVGGPTYFNMVSVRLQNCRYCVSLPTLGQLPSLEDLEIEGFDGLVRVDAEFCRNRTTCAFTPFGSLEVLKFTNMSKWKEWCRCDVEKPFPLLRKLLLTNCPKLEGDLPSNLPLLTDLEVSKCPALGGSMARNEQFQFQLTNTCLEILRVDGCSITSLPKMNSACPLQSLTIIECSSLLCLPKNIGMLSSLKSLEINKCEKLELPTEQQFASLEKLTIRCNDALRSFPLHLFPKLSSLWLQNCKNLESFSYSLLSQLTELNIDECPNLLSLSAQGFPFPNLCELLIKDCSHMKLLGEQEMQALSSPSHHLSVLPLTLTSIYISNCDKLLEELLVLRLISGLHSLAHLRIEGRCEGVKSFPQEGCLPASLNSLTIECFLNLETLQYRGLHSLTSLSSLEIENCGELQCLEGLPTSLSRLDIRGCPRLVRRLQGDQGEDRDKIALIPKVFLDGKEVLK